MVRDCVGMGVGWGELELVKKTHRRQQKIQSGPAELVLAVWLLVHCSLHKRFSHTFQGGH